MQAITTFLSANVEYIAAVLGLANIILIVLRSIWNYPFGIVMVVLYGFVFFESRLYSDAVLQLFFLVVQAYGWWNWSFAQKGDGQVKIELMTQLSRLIWLGVLVVTTAVEGWYLATYTNDVAPWLDATTTALSVVAHRNADGDVKRNMDKLLGKT